MQNDPLAEQAREIEDFCAQNSIAVFSGHLVDNSIPKVQWAETDHNWKNYLEALKTSGAKLLILTTKVNQYDEQETSSDEQHSISEQERLENEQTAAVLKEKDGHIARIALSFFIGGVCYQYSRYAPWLDEVTESDDPYDLDEEDEDDEDFDEDRQPRLSSEQLNEKAQSLLKDEEYRAGKTPNERRNLAILLLESESFIHRFQAQSVAAKAEALYQEQEAPKLREQVIAKLRELKRANPKITKIEAASRLGLSEKELNKIWYEV